MHARWWLVFVFGGVVVGVAGASLPSGTAQFVASCLGVLLVALALYRRAGGTDCTESGPYHRAAAASAVEARGSRAQMRGGLT